MRAMRNILELTINAELDHAGDNIFEIVQHSGSIRESQTNILRPYGRRSTIHG